MHLQKELIALSAEFDGTIQIDSLHRKLYATDASVYRKLPLAVAYPFSAKGIKQLIAFAAAHKTSLVPRTAGTSLAGQCVGEGIVVDVSRHFNGILSVDEKNKTVTLQPGVIRDELNAFLQPFGLFFGPNTSTSNRCMIGGMVGNNSSGTTSIQYGVTRDKVLRLKTVLSNGEEVLFEPLTKRQFIEKCELPTLEGRIYKVFSETLSKPTVQDEIARKFPKQEIHRRNTGYAIDALLDNEVFNNESSNPFNLCHLLCGSEGTLAFTTEITLQLDELPPEHAAMVVAQYTTLQQCLDDVVVAMKHQLHTCEMMDDVILNCTKKNRLYDSYRFFVEGAPKALLMLEIRATSEEELAQRSQALLQSLERSQNSYAAPVLHGESITMALELRKAGLGLLGNMVGDAKAVACIEDTAVALADLPSYIKEFSELMASYGQQAVYYAHAGAGELHLRPILNLKEKEGVAYFRNITTDVAHLVRKYRGSFSGEHGDGIVRAEFLRLMVGEKNFELLKYIKTIFDPNNIFNPGKITDAWPMDQSLRYEPGRAEPQITTQFDFSDSEGLLRLAEKCNGSGDCRKTGHAHGAMCPSYHATKNEKDTTRARANALREVLSTAQGDTKFDSNELKEVFDLCIGCKACASECPSNVDMAAAKMEFLFQYGKHHKPSLADRLFAHSSTLNKWGRKVPKLVNFLYSGTFTSNLIKNISGVAPQRSLPNISTVSLTETTENTTFQQSNVYLFVDEFSNYLETDIAQDAYDVLTALGYRVEVVSHLDSARALLSKGYLKTAQKKIDKAVAYLSPKISAATPLVGIEPSAILGFRDEFPRLAKNREQAQQLAQHCYLVEEFIAAEISEARIKRPQFTTEEKHIKIHVHCHQKALSNQKVTFDILNFPENYKPTIIPSGCCGMAGSFGYEKEHYDISMAIGELKLFPAVRKTNIDTIIAANGTSCRHQILDGTGRKAQHPITILKNALAINSVS